MMATIKSSRTKTHKKLWNSDTNYALGFYRQLTTILGIWPLKRNRRIPNLQVIVICLLQFAVIFIFTQNLIIKENCGVVTDILDALTVIVTSILSVAKIVFPVIYQESMYCIVDSAVMDWSNVTHKKHHEIMLKYAYMGRIVFIIQMVGSYITIIPLIFGNLPNISLVINEENNTDIMYRNILVGPNCWVSPFMSTTIYLLYYSLLTADIIILCAAYNGGDVYIFGIAMHLCGQFQLLYNKMENFDAHQNYFLQRRYLNHLCERHNHLVKLANAFEKTFNLVLLIQVIASTLIIGISSVLLLLGLRNRDSNIIVGLIVRINVLYFELFIYSYIGEELSTQAAKLQEAIYNCPWYKMSPDIVRDLSFIILRNNIPCYLTAGKILKMNISNYRELVRTMFSYFSVLRLMFGA